MAALPSAAAICVAVGSSGTLSRCSSDSSCAGSAMVEEGGRKKGGGQRHSTTFCPYINIGDKNCKLIIDGDICMNVIFSPAVSRLGVKHKPHPQSFKAARVNMNTISLTCV